jgi:hypothetical protein
MGAPFELDARAIALLDAGVAVVLGSASAARWPEICRAWGPLWRADEGLLDVVLPMPAATRTIRNLEEARSVAITFSAPTDYTAFQVKGDCVSLRDVQARHWRRARQHFERFLMEAASVGLDPAAFAPWFPADGRLMSARIDAAFCQTPGPNAGVAL